MTTTHKATILIIEDEAGFRRVYEDIFTSDGYSVLMAEDGKSGWKLAMSEKPNLIVLDLILPELHGFQVLRKIRTAARTKNVPVLISSVLGGEEVIQIGRELGANDYIVKGFSSPHEVLDKVHALLAS